MGLFRNNEEKKEEQRLDGILRNVPITPESRTDYEKRVGYSVVPIDTGGRDKGVFIFEDGGNFNSSITVKKRLVDSGVEALVNAIYCNRTGYASPRYYALPVRKA